MVAQGWGSFRTRVQGVGMGSRMEVQDWSGDAGHQDQEPKSKVPVPRWRSWRKGVLGAQVQDQVGVLGFWGWVLSPPSTAAALSCGDGRGAVFLRAQVPAGSQAQASPASAAAPAMPGAPQGPHLPPRSPHYLQQEVCELGFRTVPDSPPFLPLPSVDALG